MEAEILIPMSMFGSIFGIAYIFYKTRHIERLALIEKGASAELFESKKQHGNLTLKIGMLFVGVALGLLLATLLDQYTIIDEASYPIMVFLFGGLALILNDFIERKRSELEK